MKMDVRILDGDVVEARFEGHKVRTAQDGSSPGPFDLFLASLATCTGYYISTFCRHRGIPVEGIRITQTAIRDEDTHMVSRLELDIELPDDFPERYRDAVLRVAGQCTVKKHLVGSPPIIAARLTEPARERS